ncbi:replication initiation protein [Pandoraea oxalativorans]|uniref:Replication protein A n=1 Tax=Pandoraea oxalativorans TaxID=573737 RepID=A0A0G3IGX8_9BURK|nr:replication initiation protein [Pandoraea oxalativorans]AKK25116.1 replication protein A [Pandoraea oxalativorans]
MTAATAQQTDNQTDRFFQAGTALNRVLTEAPYLPRCSENKTATRVRPREYAIRYPYMQVNRPGFVSWLIFDLDHSKAMIWEDAGLPAPNLIVRNRKSGHSHLYYAIPPVCTTEAARSKPIQYMKAVYAAFAARLDADTDFHSGPVAKTPGHPWWLTHELHAHVYELDELADYVELAVSSPWGKGPQLDEVSHSRHCILFEHLRYYAYSIVNRERERGSFATFTRLVEAYAYNRNSFQKLGFSHDLPLSSLRATVKSVARWTWDRYTGSGRCHRGVMALDKDLPLVERQRLAAARTHDVRHKATESKVRAACRLLQQKGEALTQAAIGRVAGLTRQTVAAYKHVLEEVLKPAAAAVLEVALAKPFDVKHGTHQVTAAPQGAGVSVSLELFPAGSDVVLVLDG